MAKGLRSKIKRIFRTQKRLVQQCISYASHGNLLSTFVCPPHCRTTVSQAPRQLEGEARQHEILKEILEAPKPGLNDPMNDDPSSNKMETDALDDLPP